MLHITNGDCAVVALRQGGFDGRFLPWRDVLHEGPVPANLDLHELSRVRAEFIAECGWAERAQVQREFRNRDAALEASLDEDEIVLWFESDLYDQLQLLQLLDWFASTEQTVQLSLICVDTDPRTGKFLGLGALKPADHKPLYLSRALVTQHKLRLGSTVWQAFRAPSPLQWAALSASDDDELPYLGSALRRLIEEFPAAANGLTRTERSALWVLQRAACTPTEIFSAVQAQEQRPFMGDWSLWRILRGLVERGLMRVETGKPFLCPPGNISEATFQAQQLRLTEHGRAVLAGDEDAAPEKGAARWIGGTVVCRGMASWRSDGYNLRQMGQAEGSAED